MFKRATFPGTERTARVHDGAGHRGELEVLTSFDCGCININRNEGGQFPRDPEMALFSINVAKDVKSKDSGLVVVAGNAATDSL